MNEPHAAVAERISALTDGQLDGIEFAQAMTDLHRDPLAASTWRVYHILGDILRDREPFQMPSDLVFLERFEKRLAAEPNWPTLSGQEGGVAQANTMPDTTVSMPGGAAVANASVFRWKMLAGGLSTVLIGVVGVTLWGQSEVQTSVQTSVLTTMPSVQSVDAPQFVVKEFDAGFMVRDPQLDELMAAHQQFGGHSALQVPTGFLRNATFKEPPR